jgi:moderate conductance mechanosensitive channel
LRVNVVSVSDHPVIVAGDQAHPNDVTLLTVTAQDSKYYGIPVDDLAKRWQGRLQDVLVRALQSRQPGARSPASPDSARAPGRRRQRCLGARGQETAQVAGRAAGNGRRAARTQVERKRQLASVFKWIVVSALAVI